MLAYIKILQKQVTNSSVLGPVMPSGLRLMRGTEQDVIPFGVFTPTRGGKIIGCFDGTNIVETTGTISFITHSATQAGEFGRALKDAIDCQAFEMPLGGVLECYRAMDDHFARGGHTADGQPVFVISCNYKFRYPDPPTGIYPSAALAPGTAGYWRFDEIAGAAAARDIGGNRSDLAAGASGVTFGGVTPLAYPAGGKSVAFHGSFGFLRANSPRALRISGTISIAGFVNLAAYPALGQSGTILGDGQDQAAQIGYALDVATGSSGPVLRAYSSPGGMVTLAAPAVGTWTHVVAVYDGTMWNLYVAGVLKASARGAGAVATPNTKCVGAMYGAGPSSFFRGSLAELSVYPFGTTPAAVAALYASAVWMPS